jgi:hypothetical protein
MKKKPMKPMPIAPTPKKPKPGERAGSSRQAMRQMNKTK